MQFSRPLAKQQHANISWNYEKMAADASEPTEQSLGTTDRWHHFTYHWLTHQWWQCGWTCIAWTALWRLCHCQFVRMLSNIHFFLGPLLIGIPSHWQFVSCSRLKSFHGALQNSAFSNRCWLSWHSGGNEWSAPINGYRTEEQKAVMYALQPSLTRLLPSSVENASQAIEFRLIASAKVNSN